MFKNTIIKKAISVILAATMAATAPAIAPVFNIQASAVSYSVSNGSVAVTQAEYDYYVSTWNKRTTSYLYRTTKYSAQALMAQKLLNKVCKTGLAEDGYYGTNTFNAVYWYQRYNGLYADGLFGVKTFNSLIKKVYVKKATSVTFSDIAVPSNHSKGSAFSLKGTITSTGSRIKTVKGEILKSTGTPLQTRTAYPYSNSFSIYCSTIDANLKFGSLSTGIYWLRYTVTTEDNTVKYFTQSFTVVTPAKITFSSMTVPSTLKKGSSFSLKGTIKSTGSDLSNIMGEIVNSGGTTVQAAIVYPHAYSFSIYCSKLDSNLKFGSLAAGTYKLRYTAITSSGKKEIYEKSFTVKGTTPSAREKIYEKAYSQLGTNGWSKYREAWCADFASDMVLAAGYSIRKANTCSVLTSNIVNDGMGTLYLYSSEHYEAVKASANNNTVYANSSVGARFTKTGLANTQYVSRSAVVPEKGDLILFRWSGNYSKEFSHVGIVNYTSGSYVYTIEGNTTYGGQKNANYVNSGARYYGYEVVGIIRMK